MKLFTIGPTQMYETTRKVREREIPYFRTSEFSADVQLMDQLLKHLLKTNDSSQTVYLTASGTAAMEATVLNCFTPNDKILVISGGSFGKRFCQICQMHAIPYVELNLQWDEELREDHFAPFDEKGFTGLLVNLHETSTGQLYDIHLIHNFCKRNNMYLIVDAISTFLCDEYKMDEWEIDATIISTQKGLCVSPGMSMITMNERLIAEKVETNEPNTIYFDFKDYLLNLKRGQTPFTPAVGIVYEILDMLQFVESYGLEKRLNDISLLAQYYREAVVGDGIFLPEYPMSNAVTPTFFEKPFAKDIFQKLKDEKQIFVNPTGGELGDHSFRVSHVGNLEKGDHKELVEQIKLIYKQMLV